jgi:hypothetical protein
MLYFDILSVPDTSPQENQDLEDFQDLQDFDASSNQNPTHSRNQPTP